MIRWPYFHPSNSGTVPVKVRLPKFRTRLRHGFSLLELLVIVTIIGLMALLVLPRIGVDNASVDTAARAVSMSMMVAQRDAVSRQQNVIISFDTAAHVVRTVWDLNNNGIADAGEKSHPFLLPEKVMIGLPSSVPKLGGATEVESGARTTPKGPYFIMQRNGAMDRSSVMYFTTRKSMGSGPDHDVRAVAIARATGRAVWYKWNGSVWRRG